MGSKSTSKLNLTKGPILRPLFTLSLPIMITYGMQTAYNVADTFWLGRIGAEAVAALSIAWPLIFLLISIAGGLAVAGTTLVAQYTGAEDQESADFVAGQILFLLLAVGIAFSAAGFLLAETLMELIGAPPEVLPLATTYVKIIFGGIVLMFGFYIFQSIISGWGDTVTPMKIMVLSATLNIVLDPLLIFGVGPFPRMEVAGAAVATVFARGIGSLIGFYLLFSGKKGITLRLENMKPDMETLSRIIRIGIPSSIEQSTMALGFTFMMSIVAGFGTYTLAAFGIGNRISSVIFMPMMGFATAITIMVGQNLGGEKTKRAERIGWLGAGAIFLGMTVGGALCFIFSQGLVGIFITQEDEAVIELGSQFIRIIAFGLGFVGVLRVLNGAFRGAGDTITAMILSILSLWVIRLPLAYVLGPQMGTDGLWLAVLIGNVGGGLAAVIVFWLGRWKRKSISERGWTKTPAQPSPNIDPPGDDCKSNKTGPGELRGNET